MGKRPEAILLEGGGTLGIIYGGVAKRLEEAGLMTNIKSFAGTSAGAHAAALMAFGYTGTEIVDAIHGISFEDFLDGKKGYLRRIFNLLKNYGYYSGDFLEKYLEDLFVVKYGIEKCTMQGLYELTGNELRVGVCDVSTRQYKILDRHSYPDIPVSTACRASSAIPFFFEPVCWGNSMFVDGGLNANIPIEAYPGIPALACSLVSVQENAHRKDELNYQKPANIVRFGRSVVSMILNAAQDKHGKIKEGDIIDKIDIVYPQESGVYTFKISKQQKNQLINVGIKAVDKYISITTDVE